MQPHDDVPFHTVVFLPRTFLPRIRAETADTLCTWFKTRRMKDEKKERFPEDPFLSCDSFHWFVKVPCFEWAENIKDYEASAIWKKKKSNSKKNIRVLFEERSPTVELSG